MENYSLYSIGYGNRNIEEFLLVLKKYKIEYLIDIRSKPFSKYHPQFNQEDLKKTLANDNIKYIYMGEQLGGIPKDKSCYDSESKVDYEKLKLKDYFIEGINRLKDAYRKHINLVIMCSESNPSMCHRSKLIGRILNEENVKVIHIDEKGNLKKQSEVIIEANKGEPDIDLFGNIINSSSRKAYE